MILADVPISETWGAMEQLVADGLAKNIGVSNFTCQSLMDMMKYCKIPPAVNQVEVGEPVFNPPSPPPTQARITSASRATGRQGCLDVGGQGPHIRLFLNHMSPQARQPQRISIAREGRRRARQHSDKIKFM